MDIFKFTRDATNTKQPFSIEFMDGWSMVRAPLFEGKLTITEGYKVKVFYDGKEHLVDIQKEVIGIIGVSNGNNI